MTNNWGPLSSTFHVGRPETLTTFVIAVDEIPEPLQCKTAAVISRFMEVISWFMEVISWFMEVISWFMEVISDMGIMIAGDTCVSEKLFQLLLANI